MGKRGPKPNPDTMKRTKAFRFTDGQLASINEGSPDFWRDVIANLAIYKVLFSTGLYPREYILENAGSSFVELCEMYAEKEAAEIKSAEPADTGSSE